MSTLTPPTTPRRHPTPHLHPHGPPPAIRTTLKVDASSDDGREAWLERIHRPEDEYREWLRWVRVGIRVGVNVRAMVVVMARAWVIGLVSGWEDAARTHIHTGVIQAQPRGLGLEDKYTLSRTTNLPQHDFPWEHGQPNTTAHLPRH